MCVRHWVVEMWGYSMPILYKESCEKPRQCIKKQRHRIKKQRQNLWFFQQSCMDMTDRKEV